MRQFRLRVGWFEDTRLCGEGGFLLCSLMNFLTISCSVLYDFLTFVSLLRSRAVVGLRAAVAAEEEKGELGWTASLPSTCFPPELGESLEPLESPLSLLVRSP